MISTNMSGQTIDRILKTINDIQKPENNGKVIYIKQGGTATENGESLFDVVELS